jgi:hypothetical protein
VCPDGAGEALAQLKCIAPPRASLQRVYAEAVLEMHGGELVNAPRTPEAGAHSQRRTQATTRRLTPQRGQQRTSVRNVRLRSSAQGMGRRGGREGDPTARPQAARSSYPYRRSSSPAWCQPAEIVVLAASCLGER